MGQVRGSDLVTLQTCTGLSWSQCLIVRAERTWIGNEFEARAGGKSRALLPALS